MRRGALVLVMVGAAVQAALIGHSPRHFIRKSSVKLFMSSASTSARQSAQELCSWVESNGGSAANVCAGPTMYGLGLLAAEDMKRGDTAVKVPPACLLSAESALESAPDLATLHEAVPSEFWSARLAVILLAERSKGEASQMATYIRTLPSGFTVPLFWSGEAIKLLQYPTVQAKLLKSAKFVQSFAAEQLAPRSGGEAFCGLSIGADAFGWAVAACSSRAFKVGGGERVLCPIIDIGNHAAKGVANCEVKGTLGGAVELVALRDIALGEEVTYCCKRSQAAIARG